LFWIPSKSEAKGQSEADSRTDEEHPHQQPHRFLNERLDFLELKVANEQIGERVHFGLRERGSRVDQRVSKRGERMVELSVESGRAVKPSSLFSGAGELAYSGVNRSLSSVWKL